MTAPMTRRWRIGLLGCGRMGRVHAERLRDTGRVDITAIYDTAPAAAQLLQQQLAPGAHQAATDTELLQFPELDGVVICSPTHLHVPQVELAVKAGLHVLCEKPLADTATGLQRLLALVEHSGCHHVLAYQRRFWATYRTLAREVQSGRWGAIRAVTSHNTERWQQTIPGTWRDNPTSNPGGFLGDAGSHKIDALFYVTGLQPQSVFARTQLVGSRVEVHASVCGLLTDDVPLTMDFIGSAEHQAEDLTIHCDEADLMIRDWRAWIARENDVRPLEPLEPGFVPASGFIDILDGRLTNPAPFTVARPVWDLTQMILASAQSGTVVVQS
ncbi:MAG: Gfo/Idh/MocA family protein [Planctomycetaceae bacterium]